MFRFIGATLLWAVILGGAGIGYYYVLPPERPPTRKITFNLDSFSGYCVFRSDEFKNKLADRGLELELVDDGADYAKRMMHLQQTRAKMAVFTIDALILNTPPSGDPPAVIVMVIDETRGADAMIAYKQGLPDVEALDNEDARIALAPGSPSETLGRVVRSQFDLSKMPRQKEEYAPDEKNPNEKTPGYLIKVPDVEKDGAKAVYKAFQNQKDKKLKHAFVLWEPFVSKALSSDPDAHVLVDSSRFRGFIVDVVVAKRDFLATNKEDVKAVVQTYFEVVRKQQEAPRGMVPMVLTDAAKVGEPLQDDEAENVVKGIHWKNTAENYAHLGVLASRDAKGLQSIKDMIRNITRVLTATKEPDENIPGGDILNRLYDNDILRQLYNGPPPFHTDQAIPDEPSAEPLAQAAAWDKLQRVGKFRVDPVQFEAGQSVLTKEGEIQLDAVAEMLRLWPQYYLRIEGHSKRVGGVNVDMLRKLSQGRADAVRLYLEGKGVPAHRLQGKAMEPEFGGATGVVFRVLQAPTK